MVLKVVMKVVMNVIMNEEGGDEGWMIDSEWLDSNILQSLIVKMKQKQNISTK